MTASSVEPVASQSRLMVLLFTDLVGSTQLKAELGTGVYAALAARHDEIFRRIIAASPGAEILKDLGDGFMVRFDTASQAVRAALLFQYAIATEPWKPVPLHVRIGLHLGEVTDLGEDVLGKVKVVGLAADMAARLMSLALPNQILQTRAAFDESRQYQRVHPLAEDHNGIGAMPGTFTAPTLRWVAHGPYLFKGVDEPVEVFEVGAEGIAPLTPPPDSDKARRAVRIDEEETLGWRPAIGLDIPNRSFWHLDRKLGEGGFGEVWLGSNSKTRERRVFKFCFDAERLRSFRRELTLVRLLREALGNRADIARLYEVHLENAPYYLESEYSELGNLTEWAEANGGISNVPLSLRLDIIRRVADAIAAAHGVGVLHKDIKPSNILMYRTEDGDIRPQIADFGIGVLADPAQLKSRNISVTGFTATSLTENYSSRTGTRMYAPPEAMLNMPFTVQGDVYALGVMLYQMVVGDLNRPLAEGWDCDIADPLLRQDIAACVQGDPARRLGSARELADRLLQLPQRRKAMRWQRIFRGSAAAVVALFILLVASGLWIMREQKLRSHAEREHRRALDAEAVALQERDNALRAHETAHAVSNFLQDMLASVDPAKAQGREITVRELLDSAANTLGDALRDRPDVEGEIRHTIGQTYYTLGRYPQAKEQLAIALERRLQTHGEAHAETIVAMDSLGVLHLMLGELDEAEALFTKGLELARKTLGPEDPCTLAAMDHMALLLQDRGRYLEAEQLHRESLEIRRNVLGPDHLDTLSQIVSLADVMEDTGKAEEAVRMSAEGIVLAKQSLGPTHPITFSLMSINASGLYQLGRYEESERISREVIDGRIRVLGEAHPQTLVSRNALALTLEQMGRHDEAAAELRQIVELAEQTLPPGHDSILTYMGNLARSEHLRGNLDEAERLMRHVLEVHRHMHGEDAQSTLFDINNLARLLLDRHKPQDALPLFEQVVAGMDRSLPDGHWIRAAARVNLGECLRLLERYDEALSMLNAGYAGLQTSLGAQHNRTRNAAALLADLYQAMGRDADAQQWRAKAQPMDKDAS